MEQLKQKIQGLLKDFQGSSLCFSTTKTFSTT